jgi:hypothetical protein
MVVLIKKRRTTFPVSQHAVLCCVTFWILTGYESITTTFQNVPSRLDGEKAAEACSTGLFFSLSMPTPRERLTSVLHTLNNQHASIRFSNSIKANEHPLGGSACLDV